METRIVAILGNTERYSCKFKDVDGLSVTELDSVKFQVFDSTKKLVYEEEVKANIDKGRYYCDHVIGGTSEFKGYAGFIGTKGTLQLAKRRPLLVIF